MNAFAFSVLTLTVALSQLTTAFLFPGLGGGGGGCGCCPPPPPPPPPCIMLPQIQLPQPCIPPIMLPSLPTCGCGRKKREANATEIFTGSEPNCTDPQLRKLILKNMRNDIVESRNAIASAANSHFNGTAEFVAICSPGRMENFATTFDTYCVDGSPQQTCYLFKID